MSEKVIYARYRARASSKHRFFAFLTSPMDSPCKNTQDRGAPPRENIHVDKKKYSYRNMHSYLETWPRDMVLGANTWECWVVKLINHIDNCYLLCTDTFATFSDYCVSNAS